jgi:anaerobic selenocysteine-containing dehydrogenase
MGWKPSLWASVIPRDPTERKPNHYVEMLRVAWENRDQLPFAWRILKHGVCDGCALGTTGLRDWTMDGVHLCMVRLELMRLNTAPALDPDRLRDVSSLSGMSSRDLRALGRLPEPMIWRKSEKGFRVVSWDEAYASAAEKIRLTIPDRSAVYVTSRGMMNEHYYAAQKAARIMGTNHVDNSARLCHAASTVAMKRALGYGASTCSYRDWIGTDLIVFCGSNTPSNQPVTMKYLYYARKAGTKVAVVNPYFEPGLQRYWVPSITESALFGTKFADEWFAVDTGGDLPFLNGVFKVLVAEGWVDHDFSMMLLPPKDTVTLFPATTRYESLGGGTETSTERRIIFSPEIPGRRIGSAKPEWEVFGEVAARVRPELADKIRFTSSQQIRDEIGKAIPLYAGIEGLSREGDNFQWGGPRLFADGKFATPDGKAHFSAVSPKECRAPKGMFYVSTRRGKQFNSMVQRAIDPLTGASRDNILISREDAQRLGIADGDPVRLFSNVGSYFGRARIDKMKPGNLEVHWPEGSCLLSREEIDIASREPDYNAIVRVEKVAEAPH